MDVNKIACPLIYKYIKTLKELTAKCGKIKSLSSSVNPVTSNTLGLLSKDILPPAGWLLGNAAPRPLPLASPLATHVVAPLPLGKLPRPLPRPLPSNPINAACKMINMYKKICVKKITVK